MVIVLAEVVEDLLWPPTKISLSLWQGEVVEVLTITQVEMQCCLS